MVMTILFHKMHFLNSFFLNNNLFITLIHPFPVIRLLLWFALGCIVHRECYEDVTTWNTEVRYTNELEARYRLLGAGLIFCEGLLCWKTRMGTGRIVFDGVLPIYWKIFWAVAISFTVGFWLYLRFKKDRTTKYPK